MDETPTMPFGAFDIARIARRVESSPIWLARKLLGYSPRGIAHLLRRLWLAGEETAGELATCKGALDISIAETKRERAALQRLQRDVKTITYRLDRLIDAHKGLGFIVMSEEDFFLLDCDYTCTDKKTFTINKERWAYTYRGIPVFSATGITGPVIMTPAVFAAFQPALRVPAQLIER